MNTERMNTEKFLRVLFDSGIEFFAGVPDSTLAPILSLAQKQVGSLRYITCANEGNAVACAAGYVLTARKNGCVYMQNSGLTNALNPLLSLTHPSVYDIPLVLLIGWRGCPDSNDEPQHQPTGQATREILHTAGIQTLAVTELSDSMFLQLANFLKENRYKTCALLITPGLFLSQSEPAATLSSSTLSSKQALATILSCLPDLTPVISTTGMISRQIYALRQENNQDPNSDFFNVGAMGHVCQIALGAALAEPDKPIVCIDGDGSALMHLGGLSTIGHLNPANLIHIILNNNVHESVGGQPTCAPLTNFSSLGTKLGYRYSQQCHNKQDIEKFFPGHLASKRTGSTLLEILIQPGHSTNLPRPEHGFASRGHIFSNKLQATQIHN